jgi:hypothetical protein
VIVSRRFDAVDGRLDRLELRLSELHSVLNRIGAGIIVSLFGVIAAILAKGG